MIKAQTAALLAACILDLIFGDPDFPFHPVRLMGALISLTEKCVRAVFPKSKNGEITGGVIMAVIVITVSGAIPFIILFFAYRFNVITGILIEAVICYFMLSARSLARAGQTVYKSLIHNDIDDARKKVSMIVGRDTESLDDTGITKAAVETVAENTSDGVIAPLFYMAIGGGVFGCVYKAVNTMDSMVGYKNDKYINFGKFAAKLDDAVNYIPSRISAYLMILSAYILRLDGKGAAKIHRRDSRKHASPNSAQTESAAAGALGVQLAGDAYYFGMLYRKPYIGNPVREIEYDDILRTNRLMYMTAALAAVIFIAVKTAVGYWI